MKILLDTHAVIWALSKPDSLPHDLRLIIEDPANIVFVSAASAWEISIKVALGRIQFPVNALVQAVNDAGFIALPVRLDHAVAVKSLPMHHRDPFDRLLVAQAMTEGLTFASRDSQVARYKVKTIWD